MVIASKGWRGYASGMSFHQRRERILPFGAPEQALDRQSERYGVNMHRKCCD